MINTMFPCKKKLIRVYIPNFSTSNVILMRTCHVLSQASFSLITSEKDHQDRAIIKNACIIEKRRSGLAVRRVERSFNGAVSIFFNELLLMRNKGCLHNYKNIR